MATVGKLPRLMSRWRVVQQRNPWGFRFTFRAAAQGQRPLLTPPNTLGAKSPRYFSVRGRPHRQSRDNVQSGEDSNNNNTELPAFSLEGLGISQNMKLVLIGILGIFGTMETWVYCKWIWQWWKGAADDEQGGKTASG